MSRLRAYWVSEAKWWCSRSLEWWAAHLTALYVGGATLIVAARFDELISLKLNELGDFSAGVFGPVAFLWLVLGYILQGRELKVSSDALKEQAGELKASVDQQKEMVGISTNQLNMAKANAELENRRLASSIEPKFSMNGGYSGQHAEGPRFLFRVFNGGHTITCVQVQIDSQDVLSLDLLGSLQDTSFTMSIPWGVGRHYGLIVVNYLNGLEELQSRRFNIEISMDASRSGWLVQVLPKNGLSGGPLSISSF